MSLPRYSKYKKTGVGWLGEIPEHWNIVQSRRYFSQRKERARDSDKQLTASQKYGVLYQIDFTELEGQKVVQVVLGADILKHVEPNDFVISMRSFQGGIEWSAYRGSISSAYVMLIPSDSIHTKFFCYLFKSQPYIQALQATTNLVRDGQALRFDNFAQVPLPMLPVDEQAGIGVFLDHETGKIDALIAEQKKLLALLAEKRQATISHTVTRGLNSEAPMKDSGVTWLGQVPAHWEVASLKRYWTVTDCKHVTAEFVDDGIPLASIREVQNKYVSLENAKQTTDYYYEQLIEGGRKPVAGDLIFSRNATVGEVAQVADRHPVFAMGQDVCLLRKMEIGYSSDYLQAVVRSSVVIEQLKNIMVGSTFKRVNVEEIRSLIVPMPPEIEQHEIARFIDDETAELDKLKSEAERAIDLLKERRKALIAAAVTGKIDIRKVLPQELAA
jgi:type I restriction enzyme S subunit